MLKILGHEDWGLPFTFTHGMVYLMFFQNSTRYSINVWSLGKGGGVVSDQEVGVNE